MLSPVGSTGAAFDATTYPGAPASTATPPALRLLLVYPPELAGLSEPLSPGLSLGRAEAQSFPIPHATVSRRHAVVEQRFHAVWCLRDLDSSNGTSVNGLKLGAHPVPLVEQAVVRIGDVLGVVVTDTAQHFDASAVLPGRGAHMARARVTLERAGPDGEPVLISGETGSGKERVAAELHRQSRRNGPLVAVNCAELAAPLIDAQLFGHERGAFTGASAAKSGLFAAAQGGTLFLDEIGELPVELQPKLLRVLQERVIRPVGSVHTQPVDVRVVAATNRALPSMVDSGQFRRDLLARLCVWEIELPPLRQRREDLLDWLALLERDVTVTSAASDGSNDSCPAPPATLTFSPNVAQHLLLHTWPDNLRGLQRLVHRLLAARLDGPVKLSHLATLLPELMQTEAADEATVDETAQSPGAPSTSSPDNAIPPRRKPSREELLAVYEAHGRSIRATSRHFGKDRRQIYRWFESYQLTREPNDD